MAKPSAPSSGTLLRSFKLPKTKRSVWSELNIAFALMSVIPLLICCYLITVKLLSIDVFVGINGIWFSTAVAVAMIGLVVGQGTMRRIVQELIHAHARADHLVGELARVNEQLTKELEHRARTQEQVKQANAELAKNEDAIKRVVESLKKSNEDLRRTHLQLIQAEKMESVGRLAAGVAHEVKNPLAIIRMGVSYLTERLTPEQKDAGTVLLDIDDAVTRADQVIRGLLDFSSSKTLEASPQDFNAVIERALFLIKHELDKSHVSVAPRLGFGLPALRLDRNKMEQVFVNMFMNAIHAMPQGGTLTVTTYAKQLTQRGEFVGQRATDRFAVGETVVVVDIEDTGRGIAEEQLTKIFDPFFTTKPTGQGTGLGLAVTKSIIDMHGGVILAHNRPEGGAKFTIMLKTRVDGAS
jgi:signal transduction histidine kinase